MSGNSTKNPGQPNIGTLLRRMTLADLGLDDLEGISAEDQKHAAGAASFADSMGAHVQRLTSIGAQIAPLHGMPEFLMKVQEPYVPLHVDTSFGTEALESEGPMGHTDVGAWYRLIDAVNLVLFDDEDDYVVPGRQVSRRAVAQAVAQKARAGGFKSLFESGRQRPDAPARQRQNVLSLTEQTHRSLFGDQRKPMIGQPSRQASPAQRLAAERIHASRSRFSPAAMRAVGADPVYADATQWGDNARVGLPGGRSLAQAEMASSVVRRMSSVSDGSSMLSSLRAARPVPSDLTPAGQAASSFEELSGIPARYRGVGAGSLLAMLPDEDSVGALFQRRASAVAPRAAHDGSVASSYPSSMGRTGALMTPSVAASRPGAGRSLDVAAVRERLLRFASMPGANGSLFQVLADEPIARAIAAAQASGTSAPRGLAQRIVDDLLREEPSLPSSLGFAARDLLAPFDGVLGRAVADRLNEVRSYSRRYMQNAIDMAEQVAQFDADPRPRALRRAVAATASRSRVSLFDSSVSTASATSRLAQAERVATSARQERDEARAQSRVALQQVAARAATPPASQSDLVYGDVQVDASYVSSLNAGLREAFRSLERTRRLVSERGAELTASGMRERTLERLESMLSTVSSASDRGRVRESIAALRQRAPELQSSTLAWLGEEPVLLDGTDVKRVVSRALSSGIRPGAIAEAVRRGVTVLSMSEIIRDDRLADAVASEALSVGGSRITDLSRMFGLNKVTQMLVPDLVSAAQPLVADMVRESVRGELRRQSEIRATALTSRPTGTVARRAEIARALGESEAETIQQRYQPSSFLDEVERGVGSQMSVRAGRGFDTDRVAIAVQREEARGLVARRRQRPGPSAPVVGVSLGIDGRPRIAGNAERAESFEPRALGLARHEERVAAEVAAQRERASVGLLRLDEPARPIRIFAEDGDVVRLNYSPEVVARMVAAESRRRASLATITAQAVASGSLNDDQRRAIATSVLGRDQVALFEELAGSPVTQVTTRRLMAAVEQARSEPVIPIRELQGALREVLSHGGTPRTELTQALAARIPGLDLSSVRPRRVGLSVAYRELETAMTRFTESVASTAGARRSAGYFESLVPHGFSADSPSQAMAMAFGRGTAMRALTEDRVSRMAGRLDADAMRRLPIAELRLGGAALEGGRGGALEMRLRGVGSSTYEVVQAARLSPMLQRFAQEQQAVPGQRAEFLSHAGEPGALGATLERFTPSSAARRRAALFSAQRAMMEPVLASRASNLERGYWQTRRAERTRASSEIAGSAPSSVAQSLEILRSAGGDEVLGAIGEQVASRLADQGAALYFIETPVGLSDGEIRSMFGLGSGVHADRQGRRHDTVGMLDRVEDFLSRARDVSDRSLEFSDGSGTELAAVARHVQSRSRNEGLPQWSASSAGETVRGVALGELREALKQVGAMPIQGGQRAHERALVNPAGNGGGGGQPAPLFSARGDTMPSNQVRAREQAQRASDTGKPSAHDFRAIGDRVIKMLNEKMRDQLYRAKST